MRPEIKEMYNKAIEKKQEIDRILKRIGNMCIEKLEDDKFLLLKGNHNTYKNCIDRLTFIS